MGHNITSESVSTAGSEYYTLTNGQRIADKEGHLHLDSAQYSPRNPQGGESGGASVLRYHLEASL